MGSPEINSYINSEGRKVTLKISEREELITGTGTIRYVFFKIIFSSYSKNKV